MSTLYEKDFYGWCLEQSSCLKEGKKLDVINLAEEIESLGNSEERALTNALELLFMHILKWKYQSRYRTKSWINTINHRRIKINKILKKNPSLQPKLKECIDDAYESARYLASDETKLELETFPETMEFTFHWAMNKEIIFP